MYIDFVRMILDCSLFQLCCTWRRTTWPSWTRTPSGGWGSWGGFTSMTTRSDRWVNDDDGVNDDDDDVGLPSKCPPTIFLLRNDRLRIFLHRLLSSSWLEAVAVLWMTSFKKSLAQVMWLFFSGCLAKVTQIYDRWIMTFWIVKLDCHHPHKFLKHWYFKLIMLRFIEYLYWRILKR